MILFPLDVQLEVELLDHMVVLFKFFNDFIYLFLAVLGLHCYSGFSLVVESGSRSYCPVAVQGLLTAVASLVEHGLQKLWLLDFRSQAQ